MKSHATGYILAGLFGILAGGIGMAIVTRALPKMMTRMMNEMMQRMSERMAERMAEHGIQPDT
jgi:hypothetical protein